jgi:hypothetical protein
MKIYESQIRDFLALILPGGAEAPGRMLNEWLGENSSLGELSLQPFFKL